MIRALFLEDMSLWSWVWQSTLFAFIGLAGSFLLRRRPARACQGLFLAMLAAVLVPMMSGLVAHFGLGLFASKPVAREPEVLYEIVAADDKVSASVLPTDVPVDIEAPEVRVVMESVDAQVELALVEHVPTEAASQKARFPWRSIFLYGWMIAAFILLGRMCIAFVGGFCLLQRVKSRHCERIRRAAESARTRLGITREIRILSGKDVHSPMIWCWSNPPILLVPSDLDCNVDWVDVICHELAHWRRRDHLIGLLVELFVCILPWNPLLWWARKRIVRLSEQACDDWVLAGGRAGTEYAQSLLNLSPKEQMAFLPTMIGKEKPMKERIYRIVKAKCGDPRIGVRWALAMTVIAATLTIGVAFAQRRPDRLESPDRDRPPAEEGRERRMNPEQRAKLEDRARDLDVGMAKIKDELRRLEESGKGESEEAQKLRDEFRLMSDKMARTERELRGFESERRDPESGRPREGREQRSEILRRLEELGRETELALRRLEEQRLGRSDEAVDLHRRMWELNEEMREVRRELGRRLVEPERRGPEREDRERPEIDRHVQELARHLEELTVNARDKENVLRELEEQGKGETEDAHVVRRKLGEIHEQMQRVKEELGDVERERERMRENRGRFEGERSPEAMLREREELGEKVRLIERALRELGDERPERAQVLQRELQSLHKRIEQIERERPRFRPEELHVRREHLQERLREIEHALRELNEHGKGGSEEAHNLGRELHEIRLQHRAIEHELQGVERERPRERERGDLEREVQELRMQMNSVNEQMGEMRELLTQLLEERGQRERR